MGLSQLVTHSNTYNGASQKQSGYDTAVYIEFPKRTYKLWYRTVQNATQHHHRPHLRGQVHGKYDMTIWLYDRFIWMVCWSIDEWWVMSVIWGTVGPSDNCSLCLAEWWTHSLMAYGQQQTSWTSSVLDHWISKHEWIESCKNHVQL